MAFSPDSPDPDFVDDAVFVPPGEAVAAMAVLDRVFAVSRFDLRTFARKSSPGFLSELVSNFVRSETSLAFGIQVLWPLNVISGPRIHRVDVKRFVLAAVSHGFAFRVSFTF